MNTDVVLSSAVSGAVIYQFSRHFLEKYFKKVLELFKKLLEQEVWYTKDNKRWTRDKDLRVVEEMPRVTPTSQIVQGDLKPFKERLKVEFGEKLKDYDPLIFDLLYEIYEASSPSEIKIDPNGSYAAAARYLLGESAELINVKMSESLKDALKAELTRKAELKQQWANLSSFLDLIKRKSSQVVLADLENANPTLLTLQQRTDFLNKNFELRDPALKILPDFVRKLKNEKAEKEMEVRQLNKEKEDLLTSEYVSRIQTIKSFGSEHGLPICKETPLDKSIDMYIKINFDKMVIELFKFLLEITPKSIALTRSQTPDTLFCLTQLTTLINFIKLHKFI